MTEIKKTYKNYVDGKYVRSESGKTYTVDCLGNVVGGRKTIYNNQPVEVLADIGAKSIQAGEPVWFGCEVMSQEKFMLGIKYTFTSIT